MVACAESESSAQGLPQPERVDFGDGDLSHGRDRGGIPLRRRQPARADARRTLGWYALVRSAESQSEQRQRHFEHPSECIGVQLEGSLRGGFFRELLYLWRA